MKLIEEYLNDPCGTLSIPYWKNEKISNSEKILIIHQKDYMQHIYSEYIDEPYFRLYHSLNNINVTMIDNYLIRTAQKEDIPLFADIINRSYTDLSVTNEQLFEHTERIVYDPNLWVLVLDKTNMNVVGCGIAELDKELCEGILEWIQVLPEYRGNKIGQLIVNELLNRISKMADFATVSGKINNPTCPDILYRKCGFVGTDIWHILTKKD